MKNQSPRQFYAALGQHIRRYRDAQGMTQVALAERVHLGRTSVTNIEKGNQQILAHQLAMFAEALSVDIEALIPTSTSIDAEKAISLLPEGADEREKTWLRNIVSSEN